MILLHGVGLRAEAWNAQTDALARTYRVLAIDLPGHGDGARLTRAATLADYSDAVAVGWSEPALVIGHSMGAMIALDLAIRYPARVRGVGALNAVFERSAEAAMAVQTRADSLDGRSVADPDPTLHRWFGATASPERTACDTWLRTVDPAAYRAAYRVFARENGPTRAALAGLRCPALFLTGSAEPNSTPEMSRALAAATPKGRAHIIDGAAHMMPMTHAFAVNSHLHEFAAEVWS